MPYHRDELPAAVKKAALNHDIEEVSFLEFMFDKSFMMSRSEISDVLKEAEVSSKEWNELKAQIKPPKKAPAPKEESEEDGSEEEPE